MTVNVIKAGVLPESVILGATCRNCGCEFTFNPPDAILMEDWRDGNYYTITCPTCNATVTKLAPKRTQR